MRHFRANIVLSVLMYAAACDAPTDEGGDPRSRIEVLQSPAADTVMAEPSSALRIAVLRSSTPLPQVQVRVRGIIDPSVTRGAFTFVGSSRANMDVSAEGTTDNNGVASFYLSYGYYTGVARLEVEANTNPMILDTVSVEILPGRAVGVIVEPRDTSIHVGASMALRPVVVDRAGNRRSEIPELQLGADRVALSGSQITATAIGRAYVIARHEQMADTAWISVVPRFRLLVLHATTEATEPRSGLYLINTDGTNAQRVTAFEPNRYDVGLTTTPDRSAVVIAQEGQPLRKANLLVDAPLTTFNSLTGEVLHPQFTTDGQWLYFSRNGVARSRPDGSGVESISGAGPNSMSPSPSTDGNRIVYTVNGALVVLDFATGITTNLHVDLVASQPQWGPTNWIAFTSGRVFVARPDGSEVRPVTPPTGNFAPGVTWSHDGQWVIATSANFHNSRADLIVYLISLDGQHVLPLNLGKIRAGWQTLWMGN